MSKLVKMGAGVFVLLCLMFFTREVHAEEIQYKNYLIEENNVSDIVVDVTGATGSAGSVVEEGSEIVLNVLEKVFVSLYGVFTVIKNISGQILAISIFIGVLICVFARKNKLMRKRGIVMFFVVIPILLFLCVYGVGIVYGIIEHRQQIQMEINNDTYIELLQVYEGKNYLSFKTIAPFMLLFLYTYGIFIYCLSKYDMNLRKIAFYGLCVFIPVAVVLLSWGVPYLGRIFA